MALTRIGNQAITLDAAEIPALPASKITSGTFADARIAASNVSQHATSFDDNKIVNESFSRGEHNLIYYNFFEKSNATNLFYYDSMFALVLLIDGKVVHNEILIKRD